jgi:hypothetical protein
VPSPDQHGSVWEQLASQSDALDALRRAVLAEVDIWNAV